MKVMKMRAWFLPVLLLLAACNANESKQEAELVSSPALMDMELPPASAKVSDEKKEAAPDAAEPAPSTATPSASRKIIYHAQVRVKVEDLNRANARMDSLVRAYKAYVSDASETREDGQWRHQMKIRVLPERFQAMLGSLNGLGKLESKTLGTDDVTAEHADVSARLRTKRALEQRYTALLKQAKKVSEMLEIEEKIGEVRADIEATESKLKTLNDQLAYSTITLTYYQDTPDAPALSFGSRLTQAFYDGWELLTGLVLALVTAWPLLALGIVGVWSVRAWRQRRRRQRATAETPAP